MRYPWVRTGPEHTVYDGDVNPEGVAVSYHEPDAGRPVRQCDSVAQLAERDPARGTLNGADEPLLIPACSARRPAGAATFGDWRRSTRWAAGVLSTYGAVEGLQRDSGRQCRRLLRQFDDERARRSVASGITTCLANDFNIVEVSWASLRRLNLAGKPLTLFADYANNSAADFRNVTTNPTTNIPAGLRYGLLRGLHSMAAPATREPGSSATRLSEGGEGRAVRSVAGFRLRRGFNTDGDGSCSLKLRLRSSRATGVPM